MGDDQGAATTGHGETDLGHLVASMAPTVRPGEYVFVCLDAPHVDGSLASVSEAEGVTHVVLREVADANGWSYDFVAGWITLQVHSALSAVGLTAVVSSALTEARISCNVLAGYHHDHLLVPVERTDDAVAALRALSATRGRPVPPR